MAKLPGNCRHISNAQSIDPGQKIMHAEKSVGLNGKCKLKSKPLGAVKVPINFSNLIND